MRAATRIVRGAVDRFENGTHGARPLEVAPVGINRQMLCGPFNSDLPPRMHCAANPHREVCGS